MQSSPNSRHSPLLPRVGRDMGPGTLWRHAVYAVDGGVPFDAVQEYIIVNGKCRSNIPLSLC
jgi:hypothetical protein